MNNITFSLGYQAEKIYQFHSTRELLINQIIQTCNKTCVDNMLGGRREAGREVLTTGDDGGVSPEESKKAERC